MAGVGRGELTPLNPDGNWPSSTEGSEISGSAALNTPRVFLKESIFQRQYSNIEDFGITPKSYPETHCKVFPAAWPS